MTPLREFDVVRVVELRRVSDEHERWGPNRRSPRAGDVGAIVQVLEAPDGSVRYVVQCLSSTGDGSTDWISEFGRDELERAGEAVGCS